MKDIDFVEIYKKKNNSFRKKAVYSLGVSKSGFYSELNALVYSIVYCYKYNIKLYVHSKSFIFFCGKTFNEIFTPILDEKKSCFFRYFNKRYGDYKQYDRTPLVFLKEKTLLCMEFFYKFLTSNYLMQDIFAPSRLRTSQCVNYSFPELNINSDFRTAAHEFIKRIYVFNDKYKKDICSKIARLNIKGPYISFHIRGGDKIMEFELLSPDLYIEAAIKESNIRKAFVLTDDYKILEYVRNKYRDWEFYSFVCPEEVGYENTTFLKLNPITIESKMLNLYSSVEVICQSELFFGTCNSNVGCFVGMYMDEKKVIYLDTKEWHIQ